MPAKSEFPPAPVETRPYSERMLEVLWHNHVKNPEKLALVSKKNKFKAQIRICKPNIVFIGPTFTI